MSWYRADRATEPPELVLGFGNLTDGEIERGIATIADLLTGRSPGTLTRAETERPRQTSRERRRAPSAPVENAGPRRSSGSSK